MRRKEAIPASDALGCCDSKIWETGWNQTQRVPNPELPTFTVIHVYEWLLLALLSWVMSTQVACRLLPPRKTTASSSLPKSELEQSERSVLHPLCSTWSLSDTGDRVPLPTSPFISLTGIKSLPQESNRSMPLTKASKILKRRIVFSCRMIADF